MQNKQEGKLDKVTPKTTADGANLEPNGSCSIKNDKKRKQDKENSVGTRKRRMSAGDKEPERTVQNEQDERSDEITPGSTASSCDVCGKVKDKSNQKPKKPKPVETKWSRQHAKLKLQPTKAERAKVSELTALLVQKCELRVI